MEKDLNVNEEGLIKINDSLQSKSLMVRNDEVWNEKKAFYFLIVKY